jgi:hypothetical protein
MAILVSLSSRAELRRMHHEHQQAQQSQRAMTAKFAVPRGKLRCVCGKLSRPDNEHGACGRFSGDRRHCRLALMPGRSRRALGRGAVLIWQVVRAGCVSPARR